MENTGDSESKGNIPAKRRNYDLQFKIEVVRYALEHNNSKAAKDKGVPRGSVIKWIQQKEEIRAQMKIKTSARLFGAGRPLKDKGFDQKLLQWIQTQQKKKNRVSGRSIQVQARMMSTDQFKASNGWLEAFLKRHNLVSRRATIVCQKDFDDSLDL